jgi:hypothetical protein
MYTVASTAGLAKIPEPRFQRKKKNDPQTEDFFLDLAAVQCCFRMGKVFLNVLASARVRLVKNKVCVH